MLFGLYGQAGDPLPHETCDSICSVPKSEVAMHTNWLQAAISMTFKDCTSRLYCFDFPELISCKDNVGISGCLVLRWVGEDSLGQICSCQNCSCNTCEPVNHSIGHVLSCDSHTDDAQYCSCLVLYSTALHEDCRDTCQQCVYGITTLTRSLLASC